MTFFERIGYWRTSSATGEVQDGLRVEEEARSPALEEGDAPAVGMNVSGAAARLEIR